jgi:hypothetical protein
VRLAIESGIDPLKLQYERSIVDNILRLPIELGNVPEKFVFVSTMVRRDPFGGNSGKEPCKSLYDKSRVCRVGPERSFLEMFHSTQNMRLPKMSDF